MNILGIRTSSWAAAWLLAVALIGGCANGTDLIASGRIAVEPHIDQTLRRPPEVYEDQGDLVIAGRLERGLPRDLGGHIDISVIAPSGTVVYDAQVGHRDGTPSSRGAPGPRSGSLRRAHTRTGSYGVYSVRFPGLPPDGSVVRVRHDPFPRAEGEPRP